jgi:hypothetical protein
MRHDLLARWPRLAFAAALAMTMTVNLDRVRVLANQGKGQAPQAPPQEEKKDADIPKAPKDDFMVQVYQALDAKKTEKLTHKEKYKQDKSEEDVEVILSYFNWAVSDDDYWNRQISIDTKTTDGFVVEKIVKSGFGELGYVKQGDTKSQDVYRKEKITVTGGQATATMADAVIGPAEKERFHKLLDRMVLKK